MFSIIGEYGEIGMQWNLCKATTEFCGLSRQVVLHARDNKHVFFFLNPLRAKFFRGNINIYLHFVSFLHIETTQVVEILPQVTQEPTYST